MKTICVFCGKHHPSKKRTPDICKLKQTVGSALGMHLDITQVMFLMDRTSFLKDIEKFAKKNELI